MRNRLAVLLVLAAMLGSLYAVDVAYEASGITGLQVAASEGCDYDASTQEYVCRSNGNVRAYTRNSCERECFSPPAADDVDGREQPGGSEDVGGQPDDGGAGEDGSADDAVVEGVDLVVGIVGVTDSSGNSVSELFVGEFYRVVASVRNRGSDVLPLRSFYTQLRLQPGPDSFGLALGRRLHGFDEIVELQQGEAVTFPFSFEATDVSDGSYRLVVSADADNAVQESNEDNNAASFPVAIRRRSEAGLAIESISAVPSAGNAFDIDAVIRNDGESPFVIDGFIRLVGKVESNANAVCSGFGHVYDTIPAGSSATVRIFLERNGEGCILERGRYVMDVRFDAYTLQGGDSISKREDFAFGEDSLLRCPGRVGDEVVVGYRTGGFYCDASGALVSQKIAGSSCVNHYECLGNFCLGGACTASCSFEGSAYLGGTVIASGIYCSLDGERLNQKQSGECRNGFECLSGTCAAGRCVSDSDLKRALCELGIACFS